VTIYHQMDDKWFKKQQKRAGVTADDIAAEMGRDRSVVSRIYVGRQRMTLNQARAFANVLKVPLEDVLDKAGLADEDTKRSIVSGFSDGDVIPFKPSTQKSARTRNVASAFGAEGSHVDVWEVKTDALVLNGYLPGDYLVVDSHSPDRCSAGDVVLVKHFSGQTGKAQTLLRRFEPPVLLTANTALQDRRVLFHDNTNVVIFGRVIASWRQ